MPPKPWWRDAVVYQVYPRSFQDSDGDGIGDLAGIAQRLDHLVWLGVDALWLSPIYPSPLADSGYDVADHAAVDPAYGTLADFDALLNAAHERGLKLLLDLVPSHTSIEHPWFRRHPDWYLWADGDRPPNNWRSAFGGPAWSRAPKSGRWYLHSFYPEQPDLDWRTPEVRDAFAEVIRFWRDRGVDGFRVDAVERLAKDPELRDDPPAAADPILPVHPDVAPLDLVNSKNGPDIGVALAALREAAGDALLVGEVYLPSDSLSAYLEHLDLAFAFEFLHAPWQADALTRVIEAAAGIGGIAWVASNHDFPRLATRLGESAARTAALLLLTLPGTAFVYQGEEIGMADGPGGDPPFDRAGRDPQRHPMQWDPTPGGGFSSGAPWLAPIDPQRRSVACQRDDAGSLLALYRRLISLRRELGGELELLDSPPGTIGFRRGAHASVVNLEGEPIDPPFEGEVVLRTDSVEAPRGPIPPGAGAVLDTRV